MDDQSSTLKIYALSLSSILWNWISSLRDFKVRQKKGVVRKRNSTRIRLSRLSWLPFSNLAIWENHSYSICKLGKHLPRGLFWGLNENTCQALSPRYIFSYYNSWKYWREEGFPGGSDSKRICLQCRRLGFSPWVGKIPWKREWLLTPVFLPGEFHCQRGLVGYNPWGHKESTERVSTQTDERERLNVYIRYVWIRYHSSR